MQTTHFFLHLTFVGSTKQTENPYYDSTSFQGVAQDNQKSQKFLVCNR